MVDVTRKYDKVPEKGLLQNLWKKLINSNRYSIELIKNVRKIIVYQIIVTKILIASGKNCTEKINDDFHKKEKN